MNHKEKKRPLGLCYSHDEYHLFRAVIRTNQVVINCFSRSVGVSVSQFLLLRQIAVAGCAVGTMDLARQLGINAAAVTRLLQALEREGIIRRIFDAKDGRRSYVSLTDRGEKLVHELHHRGHQIERDFASVIHAHKLAGAVDVLEKFQAFIEGRLRDSQ